MSQDDWKTPEIRQLERDLSAAMNARRWRQSSVPVGAGGGQEDDHDKYSRRFLGTEHCRYRYFAAGVDGRGRKVRFCYSTHRNVAGFYLGWRETIAKTGTGRRDMWCSRRIRNKVADIARKRAEAFRARDVAA